MSWRYKARIIHNPRRDQIWDYPLEALREAVGNAICHRDYGDTADIQIKVFADHVRIWSPGLLPYGVTFEELYLRTHASKPRNKLIAQVFYDLEIIERYGSGIQRMLDACAAAGLPEPTFGESTGGLLITFRKAAKAAIRLTEQQQGVKVESGVESLTEKAVRLLVAGPKLKSEIAQGLGKPNVSGQIHRLVVRLLADGFVERTIPNKPNSRLQKYRLTVKGAAHLKK